MPTSNGSDGRTPALLWALVSSCSVTTRLHFDIFRTVNMRPVLLRVDESPARHGPGTRSQGRASASSPGASSSHTPRQSPLRDPWQRSRRRFGEHGSHSRPSSIAPQCFHDSARDSKQPGRNFQLDALLFWEAIAKLPDPMVRTSPPDDAASQPAISLVIATANVLTLYPQEEALRTVFRPTRDRVVMIDDNGRLGGGSHPFAGEHPQDFGDNGYLGPGLFELRYRRGHPEQARSRRLSSF